VDNLTGIVRNGFAFDLRPESSRTFASGGAIILFLQLPAACWADICNRFVTPAVDSIAKVQATGDNNGNYEPTLQAEKRAGTQTNSKIAYLNYQESLFRSRQCSGGAN